MSLYRTSRIVFPVLLALTFTLIQVQVVKASTPVVENEPATNIYADLALLNCYVSDTGTCSWYDIYFVYYYEGGTHQHSTAQHCTDPGETGIWVDYLIPGTQYFFYPVVVTIEGIVEITQPTLK